MNKVIEFAHHLTLTEHSQQSDIPKAPLHTLKYISKTVEDFPSFCTYGSLSLDQRYQHIYEARSRKEGRVRQNFGNVPLEPVTRTCHGSALHLRDFFIIHANIDYFRSSRFFVRRKLIISREYEQILHIIPRRYCLVKVPVPLFQYVCIPVHDFSLCTYLQ